jgi:hypothetical protein
MKIIGFNYTKISAEKAHKIINATVNTNIEFLNVEKESMNLLKDAEPLKITFKYNLTYEGKEKKPEKQGEIMFEGYIIIAATKDEVKNINKAWKNKEFPISLKIPLFNIILKKCTPKAIYLQDEISLPSHVPVPRLSPKQE